MPWPKAEQIQSWKDICEILLGIKFNNGREITSYPITKNENLANPSNQFTLANYDKEPCAERPVAGQIIKNCSYGQIFARIYHILMKVYADKPFDKVNLNAFWGQVGPIVQTWINAHRPALGKNALLKFALCMEQRIKLPFAEPAVQIKNNPQNTSPNAGQKSGHATEKAQSKNLPRLALGLQDSLDVKHQETVTRRPGPPHEASKTDAVKLNLRYQNINLGIVRAAKVKAGTTFKQLLKSVEEIFKDRALDGRILESGSFGVRPWLEQMLDEQSLTMAHLNHMLYGGKLEEYVSFEIKGVKPSSEVLRSLDKLQMVRFTDRSDRLNVFITEVIVDWKKLKNWKLKSEIELLDEIQLVPPNADNDNAVQVFLIYGSAPILPLCSLDLQTEWLDQPLRSWLVQCGNLQLALHSLLHKNSTCVHGKDAVKGFHYWLRSELEKDPEFENLTPEQQYDVEKQSWEKGRLIVKSVLTPKGKKLNINMPLRTCLDNTDTTEFGKALCLKLKTV